MSTPTITLVRVAPVQGEWRTRAAGTVPWNVHLQAFDTYQREFGNNQSPEGVARREGFGYREMQCLLAGHHALQCVATHPDIPEWRSVHDAWAPKSPCRTPDEGTP